MLNAKKNFCYRVCHIENLAHILEHGICTKHHAKADPKFIAIGNPAIISVRDTTKVKIKGYGTIGEYVPFYFTPRSMMLYNIVTGYQAPLVPKRSKEELIVLRSVIKDLSGAGEFFFTDGQANVTALTNHYNDLVDLDKIDWTVIQNSDFKNSYADSDKQRRYQAEFLVYDHVPFDFVESINVYNNKAAKFVQAAIAKTAVIKPINICAAYFFD